MAVLSEIYVQRVVNRFTAVEFPVQYLELLANLNHSPPTNPPELGVGWAMPTVQPQAEKQFQPHFTYQNPFDRSDRVRM
jgi:hypothetical protein